MDFDDINKTLQGSDRYLIEESIGRGGGGTVYRAYDKALQRKVAIKLISCANENAIVEARSVAKCDSPYVIQVFDVYQNDKCLGIVMELVEGDNPLTSEIIADFSFDRFCDFYSQVLQAVRSIHASNLLHLDLKPSNILVDAQGRVKVTDFGISVLKNQRHALEEKDKIFRKGSWYCLSPEQLSQESVGEFTDIFSLGILLHTYLFKKHPFLVPGDAASCRENILLAEPLATRVVPGDELAPLVELTKRMLRKKTKERPTLHEISEIFQNTTLSSRHDFLSEETQDIPVETSIFSLSYKAKWIFPGCILISLLGISFFWKLMHPPLLSTLVTPPLQIMNKDNLDFIAHQDNNLLVATIIEDELQSAVIGDSRRRLVSKKEWRGTRNWSKEAQQLDVDEIISSDVECGSEYCDVSLTLYSKSKEKVTQLAKKAIPHSNLMVLSQVIEQMLITDFKFETKIKNANNLSDSDLRLYVDYMKKVESRVISINDILEVEKLSQRNPKFLGAYILLGEAFLVLYKKESDRSWLQKNHELVVDLDRDFPDSPLVLHLKFRTHLLLDDLQAAEKVLIRLKPLASIDMQQLFLAESELSFKKYDQLKAYNKFTQRTQFRLTHGYFKLKARMEWRLTKWGQLESTAKDWLALFPESDIAKSYLGTAYINLGSLENAKSVYQQLSRTNKHYRYHVNLATVQLLTADYRESIATLENLISVFSPSTYDYLALGEAHRAAETGQAESFFEKSLLSYRNSEKQHFGHEALVLAHLGRFDEAKIALQNAARSQTNDGKFYLLAAQVHNLVGETASAKFSARKAMETGLRKHWFDFPWSQSLYQELDD